MAQLPFLIGCYECTHPPCDDVLVTMGHHAKVICPFGVNRCYSSRRMDGTTFRGCYGGDADEGVKICKDTRGGCIVCAGNYCNVHKVIPQIHAQCYKTNWRDHRIHGATLRLGDCTGVIFEGSSKYCYVAYSSRLLMRLGCLSELVAGVDETYALTLGGTEVVWMYPNSCYKCESNGEGFCFDVSYLGVQQCNGLNMFPVRGCYTLIDHRDRKLVRGCLTELNEYMIRLCDLPIFNQKCTICLENGCNAVYFSGFD